MSIKNSIYTNLRIYGFAALLTLLGKLLVYQNILKYGIQEFTVSSSKKYITLT